MERTFIHCVVEISSSLTLDVFCTHLGIRTENKAAQVEFLLEKITEIATTSSQVLMGDFNLRDDSSEIGRVLSYFNDTAAEFGVDPKASVDYIFANGYQDVTDSHVITDMLPGINSPIEFGSDHLPVVSTILFS
jgi:endonuclease/exonuclease/phosphatase family metal-dependent hydrolase